MVHVVSLSRVLHAFLTALWQYHGDFQMGKPHGEGTHFLPDGSRVTAKFIHGCPTGTALLRDKDGLRHEVFYQEHVSLLEQDEPISKMETGEPARLLYYCKYGGECPMIALTIGEGIPILGEGSTTILKGK